MRKMQLYLSLLLVMTTLATGQAKKAPAIGGATSTAAKICDDPYAVREDADGWPEGPITILFHHEKSKAPWRPPRRPARARWCAWKSHG
jgi:hypothetical protein